MRVKSLKLLTGSMFSDYIIKVGTFPFVDVLHKHLMEQNVEYLQFSFRWMNNLLMREIPLRCTIRLWDSYLVSWDIQTWHRNFEETSLSFTAKLWLRFSSNEHQQISGGLMVKLLLWTLFKKNSQLLIFIKLVCRSQSCKMLFQISTLRHSQFH